MNKHALKVISNLDCNIYVDDKYIASAKKEQLIKIQLDESEYWVKVENVKDSKDVYTQVIDLNRDRILRANLGGGPGIESKDDSIFPERIPNQAIKQEKYYSSSNNGLSHNSNPNGYGDNTSLETPMIKVEGGTFFMGIGSGRHQVTLSSYQIGKYPVTQDLWTAIMGGNNPSNDIGPKKPVTYVTWYDCQEFIEKLNKITGKNYRLPTEAEWEFAARGRDSRYLSDYSGSSSLDDVGWYEENSHDSTHDVGGKAPNSLGLYDMCGNVWEWCVDWKGSYPQESVIDPAGPQNGDERIIRGGGYHSSEGACKVYNRRGQLPESSYMDNGFRLCIGTSTLNYINICNKEPENNKKRTQEKIRFYSTEDCILTIFWIILSIGSVAACVSLLGSAENIEQIIYYVIGIILGVGMLLLQYWRHLE